MLGSLSVSSSPSKQSAKGKEKAAKARHLLCQLSSETNGTERPMEIFCALDTTLQKAAIKLVMENVALEVGICVQSQNVFKHTL